MTKTAKTAAPRLIRVGLVADAETFGTLADAIQACSSLHLHAQYGPPQATARKAIPWFNDARVLITQGGVEAVVISLATRAAIELANLALDEHLHVWRPAPLARNFAEGVDIVRRTHAAGVVYRVASWWEQAAPIIRNLPPMTPAFSPIYSTVDARAAGPPLDSWRSCLADAGGGVLVSSAYGLLESLVALRPLPDRVSAAVEHFRRVDDKAPRETEDLAAALLRFADGGLADIRAAWDLGAAPAATVAHHTQAHGLHYDERAAWLTDASGSELDRQALPAHTLSTEMTQFADALSAKPSQAHDALERHLAVTALLETVYLSSRTGQPERPAKLYELQKWPESRR